MKVYLAGPIDLVTPGYQNVVAGWRWHAVRALKAAGHEIYDPSDAYHEGFIEDVGARGLFAANQTAVEDADAMLALLPPGVRTIGTPMEIEYARGMGMPLAVICEDKSFQLEGAGIRQYKLSQIPEAVGYLGTFASSAASPQLHIERIPYIHPFERQIKYIPQIDDLTTFPQTPQQSHKGDAGFDLFVSKDIWVDAGETVDVPHGLRVEMPVNTWGLIVPRSSTLREWGVMVSHAVIDSGYRGELFSVCTNLKKRNVCIPHGTRLSQIIPMALHSDYTEWVQVSNLSDSPRGENGFGSTGR